MVKRVLRVDISAESRDFESVALEPGLPLLDKNNANERSLRKGLKRLAAQSERSGDFVDFYVCDDKGARLHDVECEPATDNDVRRIADLRQDFALLQQRLADVEPAPLREALQNQFQAQQQQSPAHRECYLFKYRDGKTWRLLWCWGYQRRDLEPAHPTICTNSSCSLLFVRRAEASRNCPACDHKIEAHAGAKKKDKQAKSKARLAAALLVLLLVAAGLLWWFLRPPVVVETTTRFVAQPETWTGPVGASVPFQLKRELRRGEEVISSEDVSDRIIAIPEDPRVVRMARGMLTAETRSPGETVVHFYLGGEEAHATVIVESPENPQRLVLEPESVELGVGTTAQLQLIGEYADGNRVDLSKSAHWVEAEEGSPVFGYQGFVEALASGTAQVRARYRANPDQPYLEASATVDVKDVDYESLRLGLDVEQLAPGDTATPSVTLVSESGEEHSALNSTLLSLTIEPAEIAGIEEGLVTALGPGKAELKATFKDLQATLPIVVATDDGPARFEVKPKQLDLIVGETVQLDIHASSDDPIEITPTEADIVQVADDHRLIGRAPGKTTVVVVQEARRHEVDVEVTEADVRSIAILPDVVTVRLDDSLALRVVAVTGEGREVELAADALTTERGPLPQFVDFDPQTLTVRGVLPTDGSPQTLDLRYGELKASAQIEVVAAPASLVLVPSGEVQLPRGRSVRLQASAIYAGGREAELAPDRINWVLKPQQVSGVDFNPQTGELRATDAGAGPISVQASYQQATSEALTVTTTEAEPVKLLLSADPSDIFVGTEGQLTISIDDPDETTDLATGQAEFSTSDDATLVVDPATGAFRGVAPGNVSVEVQHPAASSPISLELVVLAPVGEQEPISLAITSKQGDAVTLPLRAQFRDYNVVAEYPGDVTRDVTESARLIIESEDEAEPVIAVSEGWIKALRSGNAVVQAELNDVRTSEGLSVEVREQVDISAIEISPASLDLGVDETTSLQVFGFTELDGNRVPVGDITENAELEIEAQDAAIVRVEGAFISGLQEGETPVIARLNDVRGTADVRVHAGAAASAASLQLEVSPSVLRLKVGESKFLGSDVSIQRGGVDFSEAAQVQSSRSEIVSVDVDRQMVVGVSPGEAELSITHRDQHSVLPVVVEPREDEDVKSIVIEPAASLLAVGETQPLRVFLITESGRTIDRTASAILASSDPTVLSINGNDVVGQAEGSVQVTAVLPEAEEELQGVAQVTVADEQFERLVISPSRLSLAVGEEERFRVFGVGASVRRELSDHPDLKLTVGDGSAAPVELIGVSRIRGISAGESKLNVTWRESLSGEAAITVTDEPLTDLRIEPVAAAVEVGSERSFVVFGRRGGEERALSVFDGVEIVISDPAIARLHGGFTVAGVGQGATNVTAQLGAMRAAAKLTVTPAAPKPPPPLPTGLRFDPDVLTLQLGTPGSSVRLVEVLPGGREEDVDHRARFEAVGRQNIVDIDFTASGPVLRPLRVGQTRVRGTYRDSSTRRNLLVNVVDNVVNPRLRVQPDPLRIQVGRSVEFNRVRLITGSSPRPVSVNYRVESNEDSIVSVSNERVLHGEAEGRTQVTVHPVGVDQKFLDLSSTVTVIVEDPPRGGGSGRRELILAGPSRVTVGSDAAFRAELVTDNGTADVTNDATEFVLDENDGELAIVNPGGVLAARKSGVVNLRAQRAGLISSPIRVSIDPLATQFERLELEVDTKPLVANERREYRVFGYPTGGRGRQDLTNLVNAGEPNSPRVDLEVAGDSDEGEIVVHQPPQLLAISPGNFTISVGLGDLRTDPVPLEILQLASEALTLSMEPSELTVRVKELTPELVVMVRRPGGFERRVNAQFESLNPELLSPSPENPGRFIGQQRGQTKIRAKFLGQSTTIDVSIIGNPFGTVEVRENKDVGTGNLFTVDIVIEADRPERTREYRVVPIGSTEETEWTAASANGDSVIVQLTSPPLRRGPLKTTYRLQIEAREEPGGPIERRPIGFRLIPSGFSN